MWACWGGGVRSCLESCSTAVSPSTVVADVLSEFLEVAVHLILYVREVYPVGIFQKRKKYNVPVQVSPGVRLDFKTFILPTGVLTAQQRLIADSLLPHTAQPFPTRTQVELSCG